MEMQGWSKRTIGTYRHKIGCFIKYLSENIGLESIYDLTTKIIYQYQNHLHHRKTKSNTSLAITTIHTNLVAVRSFLNFLCEHLLLDIKSDLVIKLPVKPKPIPKNILSENQVLKFLSQTKRINPLDLRNKAILELLYASGIRNTELRNLTVQDIDLEQLQITIRKGKYHKDRVIPIGEVAAYWIERYLKKGRLKLFSLLSGNILFLSKSGKRITRGNLIWIVAKTARKAGLSDPVTPHSLRHTC